MGRHRHRHTCTSATGGPGLRMRICHGDGYPESCQAAVALLHSVSHTRPPHLRLPDASPPTGQKSRVEKKEGEQRDEEEEEEDEEKIATHTRDRHKTNPLLHRQRERALVFGIHRQSCKGRRMRKKSTIAAPNRLAVYIRSAAVMAQNRHPSADTRGYTAT